MKTVAVLLLLAMSAGLVSFASATHYSEHIFWRDVDFPLYIWSDGTTMYVHSNLDRLFAYDIETQLRTPENDIFIPGLDGRHNDFWSDGETIYFSHIENKIVAYNMTSPEKEPIPEKTIFLRHDCMFCLEWPAGIWSDGDTMWIVKNGDIHAYDLETKTYTKTIDVRGHAYDVWSDGTTIWINNGVTLVAFDIQTEQHMHEKDISMSFLYNVTPSGIWSDGEIMYVSDWKRDGIFTYMINSNVFVPDGQFFDTVFPDDSGCVGFVVHDQGIVVPNLSANQTIHVLLNKYNVEIYENEPETDAGLVLKVCRNP